MTSFTKQIRSTVEVQDWNILHDALRKISESLSKAMKTDFEVLLSDRLWKCPRVVVYYCAGIPESKYMTGVKHGRTL